MRRRAGIGTDTPGLRLRVALSVLALMAVVLAALLAFVNLTLSGKLHGDLRNRLLDRAGFAQLTEGALGAQELADRLTGEGVTATLITATGPVTGTEQSRPLQGGPAGRAGRPPAAPQPTDATVQTRGDLLQVTADVSEGTLILSASQANITATMHRLLMLELVGGAVALGALAIALYGTIGLALRPLTRITALASSIAAGAHGARLRPRQRRTDLGRTAEAFDAMLDELESAAADARAAEERLRTFLADASHELRTPVAGVSASAQLLVAGGLDPSIREQVTAGLVQQSQRIARLVDDLVLSARLNEPASALDIRAVDVGQLAAELVAAATVLAPRVRIAVLGPIDPAPGAVARADRQRLGQVISNLLVNAVRAAADGGSVTVSVGAEDGRVRLTVDDTGPGVAPDERERIFQRFVRLDHSSPGSGLGLAISRGVAEAHGGSLVCPPPPPGVGCRLVLELPAAQPPAGTSPRAARALVPA